MLFFAIIQGQRKVWTWCAKWKATTTELFSFNVVPDNFKNKNVEAATRCYLHFEIILEATLVVVPNTFVLQVALGLVLSDFKFLNPVWIGNFVEIEFLFSLSFRHLFLEKMKVFFLVIFTRFFLSLKLESICAIRTPFYCHLWIKIYVSPFFMRSFDYNSSVLPSMGTTRFWPFSRGLS